MTVGENGRAGRPPRYEPEKRAALGDEAWNLKDQGWGTRRIAKKFTDRGDQCSHTLVWELIKEAQDRAKFLDFVGPAQSRAGSIGRLDAALDQQLQIVTRHAAALDTGESGDKYKDRADVLDKAVARYLQLEQLWVKVTGAAMPTRTQIEGPNGEPLTPNMAVYAALERAVRGHNERTADMEENDGLDG